MKKYDNTILQKMYRNFTFNETVLFMKDIIRKQSVEIGILKSEAEEYKYNCRQLQSQLANSQYELRLMQNLSTVTEEA